MAPAGVDEINAALRSTELAAAREGLAALEAALVSRPAEGVELACACVDALAAFVLREDLEVADFRNASLRMQSLMAMDRAILRHMFAAGNGQTFWRLFDAPMGGLATAASKAPEDLDVDDAFNVGCQMAAMGIMWGWGVSSILPAYDTESKRLAAELGIFMAAEGALGISTTPFSAMNAMSGGSSGLGEDTIARLAQLMLQLLRSGTQQGQVSLPHLVEVGAWSFYCEAIRGRPAKVVMPLIDDGIFKFGVQQLQAFTPIQLCKRIQPIPGAERSALAGEAGIPAAIMLGLKDLVEVGGGHRGELFTHLLELGYWEIIVDSIRAFPMLGSAAAGEHGHAPVSLWYVTWWQLSSLDWKAPEVQPLARMLQQERRAITFHLANPLIQFELLGGSTHTHGAAVVACLFGREEHSSEDTESFIFTQENVDSLLKFTNEILRPVNFGFMWPITTVHASPLLNMCVSDSAKQLLLNNKTFLQQLVHGLLLDSTHHRTGAGDPTDFESVKEIVQAEYAECLLQLSLFPPGREAMLADSGVMVALRTLAAGSEHCWSREARLRRRSQFCFAILSTEIIICQTEPGENS